MPDGFKFRSDLSPIVDANNVKVFQRGTNTLLSDTTTSYSTGFSNLSYYDTTERNLQRNGGHRALPKLNMSFEKRLVDTGKFRSVRRFDVPSGKFVIDRIPVQVERFVRKNSPSNPGLEWEFINDMTRKEYQFVVTGGNSMFLYDNPSDSTYKEIRGNSQFISDQTGVPITWPSPISGDSLQIKYASQIAVLEENALRRLYANIKNQPADLGTDLAEGRQTLQLFAEASSRLVKFASELKRLNLVKSIKTLLPSDSRRLANDFLAYRYGVSPLIQDIYGIAQEIQARIDNTLRSQASGRSQDTFVIEDVSTNKVDSTISNITIKYKVYFGVIDELTDFLNRLGLTNPANVVWELVPFSFVVDWLIPIGPYLSTLTTLDTLSVKSVHRTVKISESRFFDETIPPNVFPFEPNGWSYSWRSDLMYLKRFRLSSLPDMPLPAFKNPLSIGHSVNALALVIQRLKGSK